MGEQQGDRNEAEETPGEGVWLDVPADAAPSHGKWRPRRLLLAGALIGACLIAAGALIVLDPDRIGTGSQPCPTAATRVPGGMSRECAIELARSYQSNAGALISVKLGRYGDLRAVSWSQEVDPSRLVWVIEFVAPPICVYGPPTPPASGSPAPATCFSYGPGISTAVLDFATGEWLFGMDFHH